MKTKKLTTEQYYGSTNLKPFNLSEIIQERVNKEAEAMEILSTPEKPRTEPSKPSQKPSLASAYAFSREIFRQLMP